MKNRPTTDIFAPVIRRDRPALRGGCYRTLASLTLAIVMVATSLRGGPAEDQFNFAEGLFIQKDYESALEEYAIYIKDHATEASAGTAHYRAAECRFRLGQLKEAAAAYSVALKQHPKLPDAELAGYNLGRCHLELKNYAPALAAFTTAAKSTRKEIQEEAYVGAGECLLQLKKYDQAVPHYAAFLEQFPESKHRADALFSLGWTQIERAQHAAAIAPLTELIEKHPDYPERTKATLLLSDALTATKQYKKAETLLTPLSADAGSGEEAKLRLAWTRYRSGDRESAAKTFLAFADAHAASAMAPSALYNAGIARYELKQYAAAAAALERLLKGYPKSAEALDARFWLGVSQFELKNYKEAIPSLEAVMNVDALPARQRETAHYSYAQALAAAGRPVDAIKAFRSQLETFPTGEFSARACHALGIQLAQQDDLKTAVSTLEGCLKDGMDAELREHILFALGEYAYRLGELDRSEKHLAELLKSDEPQPRVLYRAGWVAFDRKHFEAAAKHFANLAKRESEYASEAAYMTGRAFEEAGTPEQATAAYEQRITSTAKDEFIDKAYYRLGSLYPPAKAVPHLKAYPERFPDGQFGSQVLVKLAEHYFDQGVLDSAVDAYERALATKPAPELLATVQYGLAWSLLKQKKMKEADAIFAGLGDDPAVSEMAADSILQRGEIAYLREDYAAAQPFFARLADLKSERGERALYMLAWCERHRDNAKAGAAHFASLLERFPKGRYTLDAALRAAELHQKSGDHDSAMSILSARVESEGDDAGEELLHQYSEALVQAAKWQEVIAVCERLETRFPDSERRFLVSFRLGLAKKAVRIFEEARGHFQDTMKRTDTIEAARAQFNIATTYYEDKNYVEAAKQFLRVELLYDYGDLSPKALYHAVEAFVRAEGKASRRAAIYLKKLQNNYAGSDWTTKAAQALDETGI
ncbi:MAG: tetratricopeptide repeat protein [Verrucomicrobia bacterium]|nr:tetratricopeptide repeat protein [Verrucomicrobiota bacterium]MDA1086162.1 tetratricopeptide repeat protein [Verrucomicrobiota bacterium]